MRSIISIILSLIVALNSTDFLCRDESDLLAGVSPDFISVASFLEENFELFVEKYNEMEPGFVWIAEGIEEKRKIKIFLINEMDEAIFLDFDGANGYAILADNYILYDFQTVGDSPIKNAGSDNIAYSVISGYLYEKNGEYYNVGGDDNFDEEFWNCQIQSSKTYDGQDFGKTGCGCINDPDRYVADKYGSKYKPEKTASLSMNSYSQMSLSVYKENKKEKTCCSEGNCWAVSAYTVLQYYADTKYSSKMPDSKTKIEYYPEISEVKIYNKIYDTFGKNISGIVKTDAGKKYKYERRLDSYLFTILWGKTREYISEMYGEINGGTIWQTEKNN